MSSSFDLEALRRLPLAESVMRLLNFGLADDLLDDVFAQHRGRSYKDVICFPEFVHLLADGLFEQKRSGHQIFQRAIDEGQVKVTLQALYGKLRRVPISLSLGLFDAVSAVPPLAVLTAKVSASWS